MSAPTSVIAPTKGGVPDMAAAAGVQKMAGGMVLSPLPLGGGKRRKTRKVSKKVRAMLKKMSRTQLKKLMKGGEETAPVVGAGMYGAADEATPAPTEAEEQEGARRRRRSRRSSRKSRARKFY